MSISIIVEPNKKINASRAIAQPSIRVVLIWWDSDKEALIFPAGK